MPPVAGGSAKKKRKQKVVPAAELTAFRVSQLYMAGHTIYSICQKLSMSESLVKQALEAMRKGWRERADINFDALMAQELARLDWVEGEALKGWARSLKVKANTTRSVRTHYAPEYREQKYIDKELDRAAKKRGEKLAPKSGGEELTLVETRMVPTGKSKEVTRTGAIGDISFLRIIMDVVRQRCEITGIIKDERIINNNVNLISWDSIIKVDVERTNRDSVADRIQEFESMPAAMQPPVLVNGKASSNGSRNGTNGKH